MSEAKRHHVFISYSREDTDIVTKLVDDLTMAGFNVWFDKTQMPTGTLDWENSIRDAIKTAIGVIYCATPNARESRFARGELQIAVDNNIHIFPVWLNGDKYSDCVPIGFTYIQNIDLRVEHYEATIHALIADLSKKIETSLTLLAHQAGLLSDKGTIKFTIDSFKFMDKKMKFDQNKQIQGELFSSAFFDSLINLGISIRSEEAKTNLHHLIEMLLDWHLLDLRSYISEEPYTGNQKHWHTIQPTKLGYKILEVVK
jgi:hypothetical protein